MGTLARAGLGLILLGLVPAASAREPAGGGGDAAIRQAIIRESIAAYQASGRPCACPYNAARNGASCGGRSAYSRPGGATPLCYPADVPDAVVAARRVSRP